MNTEALVEAVTSLHKSKIPMLNPTTKLRIIKLVKIIGSRGFVKRYVLINGNKVVRGKREIKY